MNRYPLWRYLLLAFALVVGLLYTLPNFFGEAPAVQVSSGKATLKLDAGVVGRPARPLGGVVLTGGGRRGAERRSRAVRPDPRGNRSF